MAATGGEISEGLEVVVDIPWNRRISKQIFGLLASRLVHYSRWRFIESKFLWKKIKKMI